MRNITILLLLSLSFGQEVNPINLGLSEFENIIIRNETDPFVFHQSTQQAGYFFMDVTIDGNSIELDDWVGAFNGDICVGGKQWDTSQCLNGVCEVIVMGSDPSNSPGTEEYMMMGEIPTFKIYDTSEGIYYDAIPSEDIPWVSNAFNLIDGLMAATIIIDGCDLPEDVNGITSYLHLTADGSVLYQSLYDIGGFQFIVDGTVVNEASGGDAAAAGLFINVGNTPGQPNVIAFSMSGGFVPAGCGTLVNLSLSGYAAGLSNIIISDPFGNQLYFEYYPEIIYGCMDNTACNYDSSAQAEVYGEVVTCTGDDPDVDYTAAVTEYQCNNLNGVWESDIGPVSCWYVADGCTCDADWTDYADECGTCDSDQSNDCVQDCSGAWGGSAVEDECGICDGDNSSCTDCAGVPNGDSQLDSCGVCDGGNSSMDECGVCGGDGSSCSNEGDITDGCDLPDDPNGIISYFHITPEGIVFYKSIYDMGGFQIIVVGATVNGASGGAAGDAGFMISTSSSTVLGFSLSGAIIPAGCGTLVNLSLDGNALGLDMEFPAGVSDQVGNSLYFEYYPEIIYGCMDNTACNYDDSAQAENVPSTCWWANDGCTCDDWVNSLSDMCGTCDTNPSNNCIQDCDGNWGGTAVVDNCGVCGDPENPPENWPCSYDCNGDWGGSAVEDCMGTCNGSAAFDDCGVCGGDGSTCEDCAGIVGGSAYVDNCDNCVGGSTGNTACIQDCNGDWGGSAVEDCMGACNGSAAFDECGVCNGDNSTCADCAGVPNGDNQVDSCGVCDNNPSNDCIEDLDGCMDETACNYNPEATEDDGSCIYGDCVPELFEFNISTLAGYYYFETVSINNIPAEPQDWVGAFNGDICVGARKWDTSLCGLGVCDVPIMGDEGSNYTEGYMHFGEYPTFKVYDASENTYYNAIPSADHPWAHFGIYNIENLSGSIVGCQDPAGCNYNENATDPGECEYAMENYDCEGNCMVEVDCLEECGGSAVVDDCGVCDGGNEDNLGCGCFEVGPSGCDNTCGSTLENDECGVCGGGGIPDEECDCDGNVIDECGICGGMGTEAGYNCDGIPLEFVYNQSMYQAFYYITEVNDLDGYPLTADDWVATYNGDVCVGSRKWDTSQCLNNICDVPAMGQDGIVPGTENYLNLGDMPSFKIYDASEQAYFDAYPYPENYAFANNVIFNIDELICGLNYSIPLYQYNNLVSFYVLPDDNSVGSVMIDIQENINMVVGEAMSAQYFSDGDYWTGSLMELDLASGYWLRLTESDTLDGSGHLLNPGRIYNLQNGANLVSFPSPGFVDISAGLPDDIEDNVIAIISGGYSAVNGGGYWQGSLLNFEGLHGYWIITDEDISFSYDLNTESMARTSNPYRTAEKPEGFEFVQSTEQAFYFVDDIELVDGELEVGDWLVSYCGNTVTGTRQWRGEAVDVPVMGFEGTLATAGYCDENETPHFKLLKANGQELITLYGETPTWQSNGISFLGSLKSSAPLPNDFMMESAYPNPFNPTTTLGFSIPIENEVRLSVYNLKGREVALLINGNMQPGYYSVNWNADNHPSGVYFIKMVAEEYVSIQKIMLIK